MMRRCFSQFSYVRAFAAVLLLANFVVASPLQTVRAASPPASFGSPVSIPTGATNCFLLHDFNNDGRDDIVVGLQFTSTVKVFLNNGNGFNSPTSYTVGTGNPSDPAADPFALAVGDFNGDGNDDVAVLNNGQTTLTILQGNGNGIFAVKPIINLHDPPYNFSFPWGMAAADANNDGKWDLFFTDVDLNAVGELLGNGNNTFSFGGFFPTNTDPQELITGDFNGDGKTDIVTSNETSNSISALIGKGDGTFQPHVDYPTGTSPAEITRIPIGFEKTIGLAVANEGGNSISIFIGNGDGTFQPRVDVPVGFAPFGLSVGLLNGDNLFDINICARGSGAIGLLLQDPTGTFTSQSLLSGSSIGPANTARCRKADGHIFSANRDDIAEINSASGNLSILRNNAMSSLPPPTIHHVELPGGGLPEAAIGGATVMAIYGLNIDQNASVFVSGRQCFGRLEFDGITGLQKFTVNVPPSEQGAVNADVQVVNPDGQDAVREHGVTYNNAPNTITVSGITPGSGGTGGSAMVTITGTNFVSGTVPLFNLEPATHITILNSTTLTAFTPPAFNGTPGTVNVIVQLLNGTNATLPGAFTYMMPQVLPSTGNRPAAPNSPSVPLLIPNTPHDPLAPPPLPPPVPPDTSPQPRLPVV